MTFMYIPHIRADAKKIPFFGELSAEDGDQSEVIARFYHSPTSSGGFSRYLPGEDSVCQKTGMQ
jgi:hypothetical protein